MNIDSLTFGEIKQIAAQRIDHQPSKPDEGAQVNVQEIEAAMLRGEFGDA